VNRQLVNRHQVRLELDVQALRATLGLCLRWGPDGQRRARPSRLCPGHDDPAQRPAPGPVREAPAGARKQKRGQADRQSSGERRGVPPESTWTCRASQPIKGNFTTYSGERCIYHMSGGQFYSKTKPERCYATESEARQDGCRRSKR